MRALILKNGANNNLSSTYPVRFCGRAVPWLGARLYWRLVHFKTGLLENISGCILKVNRGIWHQPGEVP
ncbi:MAG TPA: hypothetical protein ENN79_06560 [Desulfobacteraceae bacterium]|nr:hypothetical protein [Desulfobacteraceae bacterium]